MTNKRNRHFSAEPISDEEFEQRAKFKDSGESKDVKFVRATIAGHPIYESKLSSEEAEYLIEAIKDLEKG